MKQTNGKDAASLTMQSTGDKQNKEAPISSFTSYMQAKASKTTTAAGYPPMESIALVSGPAPTVQS